MPASERHSYDEVRRRICPPSDAFDAHSHSPALAACHSVEPFPPHPVGVKNAKGRVVRRQAGWYPYQRALENDIPEESRHFEGVRRGGGHASPHQIFIRLSQPYLGSPVFKRVRWIGNTSPKEVILYPPASEPLSGRRTAIRIDITDSSVPR